MGKYWKPKEEGPFVAPLFKDWQTDISLAPSEGWFMGRLTGTNRARAVRLDGEDFVDSQGKPVQICQWISMADFGQIRSCVWRGL